MPRPSPHTRPRRRSRSRLWPIVLALVACFTAGLSGAAAQTPTRPATVPLGPPDKSIMHPIVFYLAHGEANACGPGCSEWITADGKIDAGAIDRLQHVLAKLRKRAAAAVPAFARRPGQRLDRARASYSFAQADGERRSHDSAESAIATRSGPNIVRAQIGSGQTLEARTRSAVGRVRFGLRLCAGRRQHPPRSAMGRARHPRRRHCPGGRTPRADPARHDAGSGNRDERLDAYIREMGIDTAAADRGVRRFPLPRSGRCRARIPCASGLIAGNSPKPAGSSSTSRHRPCAKSFFVRTDDSRPATSTAWSACSAPEAMTITGS